MYEPITAREARGTSRPMRLACLDRLASRGVALLAATWRASRPSEPLSMDVAQEAWFATREPWGGLTVDLRTVQSVSRDHGYAVPTGGYHTSVSPAAEYGEFVAALARTAYLLPDGQYLGVFYDLDENRIDMDSVYLTDSLDDAIAVGVASHSTGGAYDFATGDAVWMPHLKG